MKFHPVVFALIAFGITAVISLLVTFIIRLIALATKPKQSAPAAGAKPENKGGAAS